MDITCVQLYRILGGIILKRLLVLLLSLGILSITHINAVEYQNVNNTSVSGQFHIMHTVERVSFFKTLVNTSYIQKSGETKLGRFFIKNNTRDGYKLTITSEQGGVLAPSGVSADQEDGETPIPYNISILKNGEIGDGFDENYDHTSTALAADFITVLEKAGNSITSLTDASFTLYINIVDDSNNMEMAGSYSDTLTLTYEDL